LNKFLKKLKNKKNINKFYQIILLTSIIWVYFNSEIVSAELTIPALSFPSDATPLIIQAINTPPKIPAFPNVSPLLDWWWYKCNIQPTWKKFYQILENWELWFISFFSQIEADKNQTSCPDTNFQYAQNCTFSWKSWFSLFKLKDDILAPENWVSCPYTEIKNNSTSFDFKWLNIEKIYDTAKHTSQSQTSITWVMFETIFNKNPLVYFNKDETFFFSGLKSKYEDWIEEQFISKWWFSIDFTNESSLKSDIYNYENWISDNWNDLNWRYSWVIEKMEDWNFLIIWGKKLDSNWNEKFKNDVKIFDSTSNSWEEIEVFEFSNPLEDWDAKSVWWWCEWLSKNSDANFQDWDKNCIDLSVLNEERTKPWCQSGWYSTSTPWKNYETYTDTNIINNITKNGNFIDKNNDWKFSQTESTTWWSSFIQCTPYPPVNKFKNKTFCNWKPTWDNWWLDFNASSCKDKLNQKTNFTLPNNKYNIIWWKYYNKNIYLILENQTTPWEIKVKRLNPDSTRSWDNIYEITDVLNHKINNFKHNFWTNITCKTTTDCKLIIAWWSTKKDTYSTTDTCWKDWARKIWENVEFSKKIKIIDFSNKTETIIDENIFLENWIINPKIISSNNWDFYITYLETSKVLTEDEASNKNLDTCNYSDCWEWNYFQENNDNYIFKYDSNTLEWSKINLQSNWIVYDALKPSMEEDQKDFLDNINTTSENNIYQYPIWKSYIYKEWKQIVNCNVDDQWNDIKFYHECWRDWKWDNKCWHAFSYWKSFLPIELRSWFWKWWEKWRSSEIDNNKDEDSKLILSPLQSLKNNNEITFWWTFNLSDDNSYFQTIIKEEWEDYCKNEACNSKVKFEWFTKDFIDNYLKVENRRKFSVLWKYANPPEFFLSNKPLEQGKIITESEINNQDLLISLLQWDESEKTNLNFANLSSESNNQKWSFSFSKKYWPWYHKVHLMFLTKPNAEKKLSDIKLIQTDDDNEIIKTRSQAILDFAIWSWIWDEEFSPKPLWYIVHWQQAWDHPSTPKQFSYESENWQEHLDNYRLQYQAFVYEFYIPEITNINDEKIWWTKPTFSWNFAPKDSQLFFYNWDWNTARLNDVPKNYPIINNEFSTDSTVSIEDKYDQTSNSNIKNRVKLVDNSFMHHKIRPSSKSDSEWKNLHFNYSPTLKFNSNTENKLKYFYIDSIWNIIWWEEKKFKTNSWNKITIYNKTIKEIIDWSVTQIIKTDSIKPFISWNYLPDTEIQINILWNSNFVIKTDWEWNFSFQPQKILQTDNEYFINFWIQWSTQKNLKIQVADFKIQPEIKSHVNWEIEVAKKPIIFGNWKAGEKIKIEIFTEDQSTLKNKFSEIKCESILDNYKKHEKLNNYDSNNDNALENNKFEQVDIFWCSDLWKLWTTKELTSKEIVIDSNWNWSWQLDKELENTEYLDSKNIYFVKAYYTNETWEQNEKNNYDLISFRYFWEEEVTDSNYPDEFKNNDLNYIEKNITPDPNNLIFYINKEKDGEVIWELEIFDKSEIKTSNKSIAELYSFWWIKFLEDSDKTKIENWMWIYREKTWKIKLNQETKIFTNDEKFLKWDKIFSWVKKSKIKFSNSAKIFSYWKIKILPNWEKFSIEIPDNKKYYFKDSDKINYWFFDKIFEYFKANKEWKGYDTTTWWTADKNIQNYNDNISTILNQDEISSNKNFKLSENFNWKFIQKWEKILLKWTAWKNTVIKFSIDDKIIWSTKSDLNWTFQFYIPKWIENLNQLVNIHKIRLDNPEENSLSKEFYIKITNSEWEFLDKEIVENEDRVFKQEKWFINFSEKINRLPVFNW
jgi:hypothetical protein